MGIPQGSVIAPILFIIFTKDLSTELGLHVKYADDLSAAAIKQRLEECISEAEIQLEVTHQWSWKWRQTVNIPKSDFLCITNRGHIDVNLKYNNQPIKQVTEKRSLGLIIDENLTFNSHLQMVAKR